MSYLSHTGESLEETILKEDPSLFLITIKAIGGGYQFLSFGNHQSTRTGPGRYGPTNAAATRRRNRSDPHSRCYRSKAGQC